MLRRVDISGTEIGAEFRMRGELEAMKDQLSPMIMKFF